MSICIKSGTTNMSKNRFSDTVHNASNIKDIEF